MRTPEEIKEKLNEARRGAESHKCNLNHVYFLWRDWENCLKWVLGEEEEHEKPVVHKTGEGVFGGLTSVPPELAVKP